ncbi:DUF4202 domain-containing protein [Coraliomargarita sp. SDUM461004]|uniref:DUF4202 domain-containing protein n=1 Tax=Thalassobacterium sedimentorum TaxID=3041258 RepID=A0ABU1AGC4_9BACT|nr:DUF4202 domain-containing protein [Coraliomargarita sp. SDUM461004]MDQ8193872.1 DUF4202 domain-containing protein [Coraliomargarita sp. SDUM461004]
MNIHFKETSRFKEAIAAFDALNQQDPNLVEIEGQSVPQELHKSLAMTRWVNHLAPNASEAVHLAARCQHLCRWEVPRRSYPEGRTGYLQWRADLKIMHAQKSADILRQLGYEQELIDTVKMINLKQGIKRHQEVQLIEDALCLVFLEFQFEAYLDQWDTSKMIGILQKTWAKMSDQGHQAASQLSMFERAQKIIQQALG